MNRRTTRCLWLASMCVTTGILTLASSDLARAGLVYEDFEAPMTSADIAAYGGTGATAPYTWAAEDATIVVGIENGVTPFHDYEASPQMVRLDGGDGNANGQTEMKQRIDDIGIYTGTQVDSGAVRASFFACFNQPAGAPPVLNATVTLDFLDASLVSVGSSSVTGDVANGIVAGEAGWTHLDLDNIVVPAGARGVEAIISFSTSDLNGFSPIYFDKTHLDFTLVNVPEPTSILLTLCGVSMTLLGRRSTRS